MATSVPVPIAMPTSAGAERRRVVDAVADHRDAVPSAWSAVTAAALPSGRTSARTRSMPDRARDRLGGALVVAGEHHDLEAEAAELGDGLPRSPP